MPDPNPNPGDTKTPAFKLSEDPAFQELTKMLGGVTAVLKQQGSAITQMQQRMIERPNNESPKEPENNGDVDVDTLSKKDFFDFMMKEVGKILDTKLGDVTKKMDDGMREVKLGRLRDEATAYSREHKDFHDWTDEMGMLAKQHPTLSLSQLHKLARDGDPDKAKALDEKYAEQPVKKEDQGEMTIFGGFRPTRTTDGGGNGEDKKMTVDQALESSWAEMIAKFPALGKTEDVLD